MATLSAGTKRSYDLPKRLLTKSSVCWLTWNRPNPRPSFDLHADCHPLSCAAIAFRSFTGTVIFGSGFVRPDGCCTPTHGWRSDAATSRFLTDVFDRLVPRKPAHGCCVGATVVGVAAGRVFVAFGLACVGRTGDGDSTAGDAGAELPGRPSTSAGWLGGDALVEPNEHPMSVAPIIAEATTIATRHGLPRPIQRPPVGRQKP